MKNVDYSGQPFGRWTVIRKADEAPTSRGQLWLLRCECGTEKTTHLANILSGASNSCGCLRRDAPKAKRLPEGEAARNTVRELYKIHAAKRGFNWELTDEFFNELTAGNCHYCGGSPATARKKRSSVFVYNGIDRVDSSVGYVVGNVVSCCPPCNRAKSDMSYDQFMAYLDKLSAFHARGEDDSGD